MNVNKYLKALPVVAAMLLTFACSNQDIALEEELQSGQARIIPFKVSVSTDVQTRATLTADDEYGSYMFEDDDKLYVWGENVTGELSMTDYYATSATFEGNLFWTGEGDYPPENHPLNATVKSTSDMILGTLEDFKDRGFVPQYSHEIAESHIDAVKKFSFITGSGVYSKDALLENTSFLDMTQQTSFISFEITLEDGTDVDNNVNITITNDDNNVNSGFVLADKDDEDNIKAKFVVGYEKGTTLKNASVTLDSRDPIIFGGSTTLEANTIYRVKKTYTRYSITASAAGNNHSTSGKPMGYEVTLQDILSEMGLSTYSSFVTGCTRTSGTNVDVEDLGTTPKNFKFTVVGEGDSVFDMATSLIGPIPVTITVAKMTPSEP